MMNFNDYMNAVKADALEVMPDYIGYASSGADFVEMLWTNDSVTGNGSGSYTFSRVQAEDNVSGILFDNDFLSYLEDWCTDLGGLLKYGPEAVDVTARCIALSMVSCELADAFDAYINEASE